MLKVPTLLVWVLLVIFSQSLSEASSTTKSSSLSSMSYNTPEGREEIRNKIRDMTRYAWNSYKARCFGYDELSISFPMTLPGSGVMGTPVPRCTQWFGLGTTIIDSLSTLYMMGR